MANGFATISTIASTGIGCAENALLDLVASYVVRDKEQFLPGSGVVGVEGGGETVDMVTHKIQRQGYGHNGYETRKRWESYPGR